MKITIINFSGRYNGNCGHIAQVVREALPAAHTITLYQKIHNGDISPCGKCVYDCFDESMQCPYIEDSIMRMYHSVCSSDLAYYIVPNYCDYPCANFFIFNERGQGFFQHHAKRFGRYVSVTKKFIVVSNTEQANFRRAFAYHIPEKLEPDILFLPSREYKKVSIKGDLMDSEQAKMAVTTFVLDAARRSD